ncbi:MAG: LysR substrate-binding domain-containing protein [Gaiellaceae bacterium]
MPITLSQLTTFLAVARTGSVTMAAEQLVVTQPSVSAALSALSRELGVALTRKVGRRITLTAAGEEFVPFATAALGQLDQGRRAAREAASSVGRLVRVAAVTTAAESLMPRLMQQFAAAHPEIELTLEVGNRKRCFQQVLDGLADVAIGGSPPGDGRLAAKPFLSNEVVLIVSSDDELAGRRSVSWDAAAERTWLLREEGSGTRMLVLNLLAEHDVQPRTLTIGSNGAIKHAVRIGLGISLQSRIAVELELESGVLAIARLRGLPVRDWHVLWSAAGAVREPVRTFLAFVQGDD